MVVLVDATVIPPKGGILLSQLKPKDPASGRGMTNWRFFVFIYYSTGV